jgi:hypothetical protein
MKENMMAIGPTPEEVLWATVYRRTMEALERSKRDECGWLIRGLAPDVFPDGSTWQEKEDPPIHDSKERYRIEFKRHDGGWEEVPDGCEYIKEFGMDTDQEAHARDRWMIREEARDVRETQACLSKQGDEGRDVRGLVPGRRVEVHAEGDPNDGREGTIDYIRYRVGEETMYDLAFSDQQRGLYPATKLRYPV